MRTKFFAIAALVLGLASCQKDFAPEANFGGEIDFQLAVSAPELSKTRAGVDGAVDTNNAMDSAFGAIDYLDGASDGVNHDRVDWNDVDIRYSLEVYDADDLTAKPIKDRIVIIKDKYEPVTFDLRLIPNRNYRFVVFADFVDQGASKDADQTELGLRHTINGTLQNIAVKEDKLNDERADAYFKSWDFTPTSNTHNRTEATLTRPYAKLRVVATDLAELNLNIDPASVEVRYTATHPATFNAVTGEIEATTEVESVYEVDYAEGVSKLDLSNHTYTANYDDKAVYYMDPVIGERRHSHMTLFTDYILATDTQQAVSFKMTVKDGNGENIKITDFNTTIPIQRNHLTTIIGNVLTSGVDVEITINDNFASEAQTDASLERRLLETLINGGKFVLTEDLTLTAPHFLQGIVDENGVVCRADAVIDLNGKTLKYVIPSDVTEDVANKYAIFVRVLENASLTFIGEGQVISDGYIASVNKGGVLNVSEGTFKTNSCTVFQSNGGEINIAGGVFEAEAYNGDHRYTINFVDSMKQEGLIEITGGSFYKYNPEESLSENPAMNFVAAGYTAIENGDYFDVVVAKNIDLFADHAEVYSAEGLLQWAYIVNNGAISAFEGLQGYDAATFDKKAYGLKVMANIKMPAKTIVADAAKETYVFTDEVITVTDGVASGSNWIPVCGDVSDYVDGYRGWVDGQNKKISGLRINTTSNYVGLIGFTYDFDGGFVKDLTFNDAVIKGNTLVGAAVGNAQNGVVVENIKVANSTIMGTGEYIGGVTGRVYHRTRLASGTYVGEKMACVLNCSTDENTVVKGGSNVGGITGSNDGSIVALCVNNARVEGTSSVGGITGVHQSYNDYTDAYIVGCQSTDKATIKATATKGCVGGIAGYTRTNEGHDYTRVWIVATTSMSKLEGAYCGSFIGNGLKNNGQYSACITASYAVTNLTKFYGYNYAPNIEASYNVASASEITEADVQAMNAAIEAFNVSEDNRDFYNTDNAQVTMTKRWFWTANGPVLQ